VRTRKVGHFFPGGTVDAFDVWLELQATDEKGQTIFWSGRVEDDGKGPVEPGAHFYRSLQIDGHANPINKRNAWATRSVVYVHLIPPGAADAAHYRLHIPENAEDKITLHARLNYRKFSWLIHISRSRGPKRTKRGRATLAQQPRLITTTASGLQRRHIDGVRQRQGHSGSSHYYNCRGHEDVASSRTESPCAPTEDNCHDRGLDSVERLRNWTFSAGRFGKPPPRRLRKSPRPIRKNPDGWTNIGRVLVQEGDTAGARKVLEKSLAIDPRLARTNFFYARALKEDGEYEAR